MLAGAHRVGIGRRRDCGDASDVTDRKLVFKSAGEHQSLIPVVRLPAGSELGRLIGHGELLLALQPDVVRDGVISSTHTLCLIQEAPLFCSDKVENAMHHGRRLDDGHDVALG